MKLKNMKLDKKTLDYLSENNVSVEIRADVTNPSSGQLVELDLEDIEKFVEDRTKFSANYYGLTIEQFQKWMDWQGAAQCGVMTKRGKRCKRQCGIHLRSAERWLENEGGVCTYHENEEWHDRVREIRKTSKAITEAVFSRSA